MPLSKWARNYLKRQILAKDKQLAIKELAQSDHCSQHGEDGLPTNKFLKLISIRPKHLPSYIDACPCQGKIWYNKDRVEEAIKRLDDGVSLYKWCWWYIRSSSELTI
jgi:hypothetical protein